MVFEVEAEPDEVEKSLSAAYHHLVGRIEVPGFRRGKAPRSMLERHIGRGALLDASERYILILAGTELDDIFSVHGASDLAGPRPVHLGRRGN